MWNAVHQYEIQSALMPAHATPWPIIFSRREVSIACLPSRRIWCRIIAINIELLACIKSRAISPALSLKYPCPLRCHHSQWAMSAWYVADAAQASMLLCSTEADDNVNKLDYDCVISMMRVERLAHIRPIWWRAFRYALSLWSRQTLGRRWICEMNNPSCGHLRWRCAGQMFQAIRLFYHDFLAFLGRSMYKNIFLITAFVIKCSL